MLCFAKSLLLQCDCRTIFLQYALYFDLLEQLVCKRNGACLYFIQHAIYRPQLLIEFVCRMTIRIWMTSGRNSTLILFLAFWTCSPYKFWLRQIKYSSIFFCIGSLILYIAKLVAQRSPSIINFFLLFFF